MSKQNIRRVATLVLAVFGLTLLPTAEGRAQGNSRTFVETGKTVGGRFLQYWQESGGLAQQGYPISGEMQERSETDGKLYTVQYFERAVFEMHPENAVPTDVLLSLLGAFRYGQKYTAGAPNQKPNTGEGSRLFPETGKRVGGAFLQYWGKNGGLAQQGLPISDEFQERSETDGKMYTVQYFERAVFEMHPENAAPYNVLLSQLGTFRYGQKYAAGGSTPVATRAPSAPTATRVPVAAPTATPVPAKKIGVLAFGSFDRKDDQHYASGQAIISRQEDGTVTVRLQNLDAANGPDLYVYVTEHPDPKNSEQLHQGGYNLGKLKATNGSFNYTLDPSIDPLKIKAVVIYCKPFSVIFSTAKLQAP